MQENEERAMRTVEALPPTRKRLMRDVWNGVLGTVRKATEETGAWAVVYDDNPETCEQEPLPYLGLQDVHVKEGAVYGALHRPPEIRPAASVRGALMAHVAPGDREGKYEITVRGTRVYARYILREG